MDFGTFYRLRQQRRMMEGQGENLMMPAPSGNFDGGGSEFNNSNNPLQLKNNATTDDFFSDSFGGMINFGRDEECAFPGNRNFEDHENVDRMGYEEGGYPLRIGRGEGFIEGRGGRGEGFIEERGVKGEGFIEERGVKGEVFIEERGGKGEGFIEERGGKGEGFIEERGGKGEGFIEERGGKGEGFIEERGRKGEGFIEERGEGFIEERGERGEEFIDERGWRAERFTDERGGRGNKFRGPRGRFREKRGGDGGRGLAFRWHTEDGGRRQGSREWNQRGNGNWHHRKDRRWRDEEMKWQDDFEFDADWENSTQPEMFDFSEDQSNGGDMSTKASDDVPLADKLEDSIKEEEMVRTALDKEQNQDDEIKRNADLKPGIDNVMPSHKPNDDRFENRKHNPEAQTLSWELEVVREDENEDKTQSKPDKVDTTTMNKDEAVIDQDDHSTNKEDAFFNKNFLTVCKGEDNINTFKDDMTTDEEDFKADDVIDDASREVLNDPNRASYFCKICRSIHDRYATFAYHLNEKLHKRNFKRKLKGKLPLQKKMNGKHMYKREDLGKESLLMKAFKQNSATRCFIKRALGLSYVTEYQSICSIEWICHLCGFRMSKIDKACYPHRHVTGLKHLLNYVKLMMPREYARLNLDNECLTMHSSSDPLKAILRNLRVEYGQGKPKLMVFELPGLKEPQSLNPDNQDHDSSTIDDHMAALKISNAFQEYVEEEYQSLRKRFEEALSKGQQPNQIRDRRRADCATGEFYGPPVEPNLNHSPYPPLPQPLPHTYPPHPYDRPLHHAADSFHRKRHIIDEAYLDPDHLRGHPRQKPYLDSDHLRGHPRQKPYLEPHHLRGQHPRQKPYLDSDPLRRHQTDNPYYTRMLPEPYLERIRRPVPNALEKVTPMGPYLHPDPLKRMKFDEPYIDPDPLKRVLPSQKAAKKPVVIDYGHGSEKKSSTAKADEWEKDFIDIVSESKPPDSLALLSCTYSSPKREDTPPHQPKKELPFSKSYIEKSKLWNQELSSSSKKKDRSPSSPRTERRGRSPSHGNKNSFRRKKSHSPGRRYRRSRSSERLKQTIKYERKNTVEDKSCSPSRKYRRSRSPQKRDVTFRKYKRSKSPESIEFRTTFRDNDRVVGQEKCTKAPEAKVVSKLKDRNQRLENLSKLPDREGPTVPRNIGPIIDLTTDGDIDHCSNKDVCIPPRKIEKALMEMLPKPQGSDDVNVDDAHTEMIADVLTKMPPRPQASDDVNVADAHAEMIADMLTKMPSEPQSRDDVDVEDAQAEMIADMLIKMPPKPQVSDNVDVDDAHAEMIADMLIKMQNPLMGQEEMDSQSVLKAFLSQDLTQLLLATKQITQEVPSSPVKRTKCDEGDEVQGDPVKSRDRRAGPSQMKVDTKVRSKPTISLRDKIPVKRTECDEGDEVQGDPEKSRDRISGPSQMKVDTKVRSKPTISLRDKIPLKRTECDEGGKVQGDPEKSRDRRAGPIQMKVDTKVRSKSTISLRDKIPLKRTECDEGGKVQGDPEKSRDRRAGPSQMKVDTKVRSKPTISLSLRDKIPVKRTECDEGDEVQGDPEKSRDRISGPSQMNVDTKVRSKPTVSLRDKINFGISGRSKLSSRSALYSLEEDSD